MPEKIMRINSIVNKSFVCFFVKYASNNAPVIIIINENLKIDSWIKTTANIWAQLGYIAITPDLSHKVALRLEIKTKTH